MQQEFIKIRHWDSQIQELALTYPIDLTHMRNEIDKAKTAISQNYHVTFDYYLEQISVCEKWQKEADMLLDNRGTQEESHRLIKLVEEDPEGDLKLIDIDLYARVKAYCFSKIFDFSDRP